MTTLGHVALRREQHRDGNSTPQAALVLAGPVRDAVTASAEGGWGKCAALHRVGCVPGRAKLSGPVCVYG